MTTNPTHSHTYQIPTDQSTREICQRCNRTSPVGFYSPSEIWLAVTQPGHWQDSILCIMCFAQLGDEKHIKWEQGIKFFPVSYATHHERRLLENGW